MVKTIEGKLDAKGLRFCLVVSRFNELVSKRLVEGAIDALLRHGASEKDIEIVKVPGAFEIPFVAKIKANSGNYDAIVCLGAIIRGFTPHFEYIASEVAKGIALTCLETQVPISFGVLTTDNIEQALERAGAKSGNKGWDAAIAGIEMANLVKTLTSK